MNTSHQILLVCPRAPALASLTEQLKRLDMVVTTATSCETARKLAERVPGLSLVVIDASGSPEQASALLTQIKDRNRRLPVLWIGPDPVSPFKPDERHNAAASCDMLMEAAQLLMLDDLYPPLLVRAFVSACNTALTSTFDCAVECAEPRLSRSVVRPGDITAFMLVNSIETTAHCMLSAEEDALFALGQRIGFEPTAGKRQLAVDMAGELVNQIFGRMKATSEPLSGIRLALPYVLSGDRLCVYAPSPKPSLAVQIDINSAILTADFWFRARVQPNRAAEQAIAELVGADGLF